VTTINTSYLTSYANIAQTAYSTPTPTPVLAPTQDDGSGSSSSADPSSTITLSDAAKAFLAAAATAVTTTPTTAPSLSSVASDARTWFDQQYKTLGIKSAMVDGDVAVDLTGQSRATLSAVASNAQGLFSSDEQTAASDQLQSRFDDAMTPYVVIARNSGNYATLYQAASDYLDQAGPDEKATKTWQDEKKAVVDGLAAAKKTPGQAPVTGDDNDPILDLLETPTASGEVDPDASTATVAANARAMLTDQANNAKDNGKELSFDANDASDQQVDFSQFDNRTLATMALNTDGSFSSDESSAAKAELNDRTRTTMLSILNPSSGSVSPGDATLALIKNYANMSDEEKSALGVTDAVTNRLVQNYQMIQSLQNAFGASAMSGAGSMMGSSAFLGSSALLGGADTSGASNPLGTTNLADMMGTSALGGADTSMYANSASLGMSALLGGTNNTGDPLLGSTDDSTGDDGSLGLAGLMG
jgi:hypothetical protein